MRPIPIKELRAEEGGGLIIYHHGRRNRSGWSGHGRTNFSRSSGLGTSHTVVLVRNQRRRTAQVRLFPTGAKKLFAACYLSRVADVGGRLQNESSQVPIGSGDHASIAYAEVQRQSFLATLKTKVKKISVLRAEKFARNTCSERVSWPMAGPTFACFRRR